MNEDKLSLAESVLTLLCRHLSLSLSLSLSLLLRRATMTETLASAVGAGASALPSLLCYCGEEKKSGKRQKGGREGERLGNESGRS